MKTAKRNYGVHIIDVAAPALANRVASGNSALVVGTNGAGRCRFLLDARGIKVITLSKRPRKIDVLEAAGVLRAYGKGLAPAPCVVFIPKWKNVPRTVRGALLESADVVAVLLPVYDRASVPAIFDADELTAAGKHWFKMNYDPDEYGTETGWAAAITFEPEKIWTPDGAVWA